MRYSNNDQIDKIIKNKVAEGWTVQKGGKHDKLVTPRGRKIPFAGTPRCPHAGQNFAHQLRRVEQEEAAVGA